MNNSGAEVCKFAYPKTFVGGYRGFSAPNFPLQNIANPAIIEIEPKERCEAMRMTTAGKSL